MWLENGLMDDKVSSGLAATVVGPLIIPKGFNELMLLLRFKEILSTQLVHNEGI